VYSCSFVYSACFSFVVFVDFDYLIHLTDLSLHWKEEKTKISHLFVLTSFWQCEGHCNEYKFDHRLDFDLCRYTVRMWMLQCQNLEPHNNTCRCWMGGRRQPLLFFRWWW